MRLINADKLKQSVTNEMLKANPNSHVYLTLECVIADIDEQPTAYDVDKVVKKLEKYRKIMESPIIENCFEKECDCSDCTVCCFNKAIEIVKSGLNAGTED